MYRPRRCLQHYPRPVTAMTIHWVQLHYHSMSVALYKYYMWVGITPIAADRIRENLIALIIVTLRARELER